MTSFLPAAEVNPGSYAEFTAAQGIDPRSEEALLCHSQALAEYREALAAERGVDPYDLHILGGRALQSAEL